MILADTSIWVQHFRRGVPDFAAALIKHRISIHSVVIGEVAMGNLSRRTETLADLGRLPRASTGTMDECLAFLERHSLHGRGLGWNDIQLLVAAKLSGHTLWSIDRRLAAEAEKLGVAHRG